MYNCVVVVFLAPLFLAVGFTVLITPLVKWLSLEDLFTQEEIEICPNGDMLDEEEALQFWGRLNYPEEELPPVAEAELELVAEGWGWIDLSPAPLPAQVVLWAYQEVPGPN